MKYHKKLKRTDLIKYGWRNVLLMIASEYSRANNLSNNGGGKEIENCLGRAKELFGVLESSFEIPWKLGLQLLPVMQAISSPINKEYRTIFNKLSEVASY